MSASIFELEQFYAGEPYTKDDVMRVLPNTIKVGDMVSLSDYRDMNVCFVVQKHGQLDLIHGLPGNGMGYGFIIPLTVTRQIRRPLRYYREEFFETGLYCSGILMHTAIQCHGEELRMLNPHIPDGLYLVDVTAPDETALFHVHHIRDIYRPEEAERFDIIYDNYLKIGTVSLEDGAQNAELELEVVDGEEQCTWDDPPTTNVILETHDLNFNTMIRNLDVRLD